MSYQKQSFGMMDEGYFVPRGELIDWMNELLDLNITKIEQLGAGSVYCQIVDVIHPGKVAMNKVNWKAKNDYEFINNMKILQTAFDKAGVKRYVDVEKLIKAKYQDNLQFIQWLKRYYDLNCGGRGNDYNPQERRGNVVVDLSFADKNVVPKSFNSVGQIIDKKQLPGKKVPQVLPTKSTETRPKVQHKPDVKMGKREESKAQTVKLGAHKGEKWEQLYHEQAEKNKELMMKLGMIQEVLQSHDDNALKVAMLEEIMSSSKGKHEEMEIEGHHDQHEGHDEETVI